MVAVIGRHTPYMRRIPDAEGARPGALIPDIYKICQRGYFMQIGVLKETHPGENRVRYP